MATDSAGVTEIRADLDPNYVRFCPIHRLAFDPDSTVYRDAGRCCPQGGEVLRGYLARFRDLDGMPEMTLPNFWDEGF